MTNFIRLDIPDLLRECPTCNKKGEVIGHKYKGKEGEVWFTFRVVCQECNKVGDLDYEFFCVGNEVKRLVNVLSDTKMSC
jgi:DnaJ-class molecular chaperone